MPSVAELRKVVPELQAELGLMSLEEALESAKMIGKKALGKLRAELLVIKAKKEAEPAGGAVGGGKKKKALVSTEEAKVLDQTTSAFLPEAIAASTKKLVTGASQTMATLPAAKKAVAEVGIQAGKPPRKAPVKKEKAVSVAKVVKEVEGEVKLLEAEKKGLLKSKEAKAKARELRFERAKSEEAAEMNVKEGAAKSKALLGKVKGEIVEKVKARKEKAVKAVKAQHRMPDGSMMEGAKHPKKAALRTHKIPVEAVVPPALGHPHVPAVPKQHSHSLAAAVKQLGRVGISV